MKLPVLSPEMVVIGTLLLLLVYLLIALGILLLGAAVVSLLVRGYYRQKDKAKPLQTVQATLLRKSAYSLLQTRFIFVCDDSSHRDLRVMDKRYSDCVVGEEGILTYQGETLRSFSRK